MKLITLFAALILIQCKMDTGFGMLPLPGVLPPYVGGPYTRDPFGGLGALWGGHSIFYPPMFIDHPLQCSLFDIPHSIKFSDNSCMTLSSRCEMVNALEVLRLWGFTEGCYVGGCNSLEKGPIQGCHMFVEPALRQYFSMNLPIPMPIIQMPMPMPRPIRIPPPWIPGQLY